MITVATWNINSVRLRMPLVERFLTEEAPDVLCLQEIKTVAELFPYEAFNALGYPYHAVHGQKGYHGVATVSRPFEEVSRHDWQANGEARHVGVRMKDSGLVIENVYIPAGGDEPDREINPKFGQKLDFLGPHDRLGRRCGRAHADRRRFQHRPAGIGCVEPQGAAESRQPYAHRGRDAGRFQAAHDWVDLGRQLVPAPGALLFLVVLSREGLARE
jgi:exodeoxyribonuclease-3